MENHDWKEEALFLWEIDSMVQNCIKGLSNLGGVINTIIASAAAKELLNRYPSIVDTIDISNRR